MPAFSKATFAADAAPIPAIPERSIELLFWPELDAGLLAEGRDIVPEFPVALLPSPWREWVADTARSAGAAVDYVALGVLGAVAGLSGAGVTVRITPSWSEPLVLWLALIGGPSSGKSPALAAVRRLLRPIEDTLREEDDKRRGRHAARAEQARRRLDRWREECLQAAETGAVPPPQPPDADRPFRPARIVVDETSVAALGNALLANPRGVLVWRANASDWPAELGPATNRRVENRRAAWLEAWNAGEVALDPPEASPPLASFAVSIVGALHPDRLKTLLSGDEDSLAARFLYAWPRLPPHCPLGQRRPAPDGEAFAMLRRIAGAVGTPREPLVQHFDQGAVDGFDGFLAGLRAEIGEAEDAEAGWLGKGPGTVARLAAALALLAWSGAASTGDPPGHVGAKQVEDAIALWAGYFKPHARAVFNRAAPATELERRARRVVRWLIDCGRAEVSLKEIRREALGDTVDAARANEVIARLRRGGMLRPRVSLPSSRGGRPARRWQINPALWEETKGPRVGTGAD